MKGNAYSYLEKGIEVAFIDRTYGNDTKIILLDRDEPYVQRFFIEGTDKELVDKCRHMRELKVVSF